MKINVFIFLCLLFCSNLYSQESISLAGTWRFSIDPSDKGLKENWQAQQLPDQILLPGTTDEAGYGEKTRGSDFGILTRAFRYYGPAWYQCDITIPGSWQGKHIFLELERVMWESKVFIDQKEISTRDALNSAHRHDLGFLSPGKHRLTIRVNNDMIYNIGDKGHVYTEYTQSIWNGIVGRIELIARDKIRFSRPKVYTGISPCSFRVSDTIVNEEKKKSVHIRYDLFDRNTGQRVFSKTEKHMLEKGENLIGFSSGDIPGIRLWDDVHPNLYRLVLSIQEKDRITDVTEIETGFRRIGTARSKILVNGKPVFLRGNLDCVHFPLTGYPSCSVSDWEKIFRIYKDYGLNHVRFHSWCPPEAAFIAANRIGIYIQAEVIWIDWWMTSPPEDRPDMATKGNPEGLGKNPSADAFVRNELDRMVEIYGNHPSFAMMCIGNELGNSDFTIMESWLQPYKAKDSRRLYSVSSARKITPLDQYIATHYIDKTGSTRGLRGGASTDWDFEDVYSKSSIPVIAHEIGQWPVYPSWDEIRKYKGVLKARNLEEFRDTAAKNNIEWQNRDFVAASGALNQIMYKYEIESFLRTPSCAGIQLLSMQDYQGQGEALIGWLDVFYDSKGITTPERFRQHHDTTVTLLRLPKFVWENNEKLDAGIQLAHYGTKDLSGRIYWLITDEESNLIGKGDLPPSTYRSGNPVICGNISCDLSGIGKATKLTVEVGLSDDPIKNKWNIWVYPSDRSITEGNKLLVTGRVDAQCIKHLSTGGNVLLQASGLGNDETCDRISFYPLYWSLTFFPGQGKNTIGMLLKDKHPAFAMFPTDYHSDWQWQHIYKNARAFYINDFPGAYKPIAQPVDDFHRNNKLASIFELKAGKGKLLVCGFDVSDINNPVARQLKKSLIHYMNSDDFCPWYEMDFPALQQMFPYIEPLKKETPGEFENALLYIECGARQETVNKGTPWNMGLDKAESQKSTGYRVTCEGVWKDDSGTAWYGKDIELAITCPQGITGSLYVFFHDWNNTGRKGMINFEGRDYSLGEHKDGIWVKLHVMREDSNDGKLILKARTGNGPNLMISKIALAEEK